MRCRFWRSFFILVFLVPLSWAEEQAKETPEIETQELDAPASEPEIVIKDVEKKQNEVPLEEQKIEEKKPEKISRYLRPPEGKRIFGTYDLTLGYNRPTFTAMKNKYEKFYGKPSDYLTLGVDWYPLDFYATFGLGFKAGVYSARGNTSTSPVAADDPDGKNITINPDSKTSLLAAPLQLLIKLQMTPFEKKWVKLSGWAGFEKLYWQEKKIDDSDSTSTSSSTSSSTQDSLVTGGSKDSVVIGGAAHLQLNFLDDSSVYSMQHTIGIGYVYLTPYFEVITAREKGGLDFSRTMLGLGFTFESYR